MGSDSRRCCRDYVSLSPLFHTVGEASAALSRRSSEPRENSISGWLGVVEMTDTAVPCLVRVLAALSVRWLFFLPFRGPSFAPSELF